MEINKQIELPSLTHFFLFSESNIQYRGNNINGGRCTITANCRQYKHITTAVVYIASNTSKHDRDESISHLQTVLLSLFCFHLFWSCVDLPSKHTHTQGNVWTTAIFFEPCMFMCHCASKMQGMWHHKH